MKIHLNAIDHIEHPILSVASVPITSFSFNICQSYSLGITDFFTFLTLIIQFFEGKDSVVFTMLYLVFVEQDNRDIAVQSKSLFTARSSLKIMQTLRFIRILLDI